MPWCHCNAIEAVVWGIEGRHRRALAVMHRIWQVHDLRIGYMHVCCAHASWRSYPAHAGQYCTASTAMASNKPALLSAPPSRGWSASTPGTTEANRRLQVLRCHIAVWWGVH